MSETAPDSSGHLEIDGYRIFWERFGSGEREAVCLLNGLAMHTKAWYSFLPELHPEWDVVLYDYLGQGESDSPDVAVTVPELAGELVAIMDHLEIAKIHLMGISYGGFVALDFGRLHQDRLFTLMLSGILLSHERLFQMYQALSLKFYASGPEAFEIYTQYLYEKIFGEEFLRSVDPAVLEDMRERFHDRYKHRVHSLVRFTEAQNPFFDGLEENMPGYRAIKVPTLIAAGGHDRTIPIWQQRKLTEIIPGSRFEILEGCGHVAYLEKKDEFFGMMREFMRKGSSLR
jgi:3-oxoadipate enol-lactonase